MAGFDRKILKTLNPNFEYTMIKRHHKISYLRKDLASTSAGRWIQQAPPEVADALVSNQAALAAHISQQHPDLLGKPSIGILVIGSMIDAIDNGAWWDLFSVMLDKTPGWAKITVLLPEDEAAFDRRGLAPSSKSVTIIRGDLDCLGQISSEGMDIVYLPQSEPESLCSVFGHPEFNIWKFLNTSATAVFGVLDDRKSKLILDVAGQYGVSTKTLANRFFTPTSKESMQAIMLVSAQGSEPADLELADDHATDLIEVEEAIIEVCTPFQPGSEPEDYRLWGMQSIIKSSVDANDLFISLPRGLAVRKNTGRIYRISGDLAVGEPMLCAIKPEDIDESYPGSDSHWTAKVLWAGQSWMAGIGEQYNNTLGSKFDQFNLSSSDFAATLERIGGDSMTPEQLKTIQNSMSGGEPYSPNKDERLLFDLVDKRDEQGIISMVSNNKQLLNAFNEERLPLLVMLGIRNLPSVMQKVIDLGANSQAVDGGGRPILVELSGRSNADVVRVILDSGAPVNCCDPMGWTPLLCAIKSGKWNVAHLLLDRDADRTQANCVGASPQNLASGEKTDFDLVSDKAFERMKDTMGFDAIKALKAAKMMTQASDIPQSLRDRLLAR